jgi:hypothetical protein
MMFVPFLGLLLLNRFMWQQTLVPSKMFFVERPKAREWIGRVQIDTSVNGIADNRPFLMVRPL